ncbi:MAG: LptF/LptG family permease [Armatimonadetes bacterium]|nr:LptF/LptG family permease [Armatimonadota bacterium]
MKLVYRLIFNELIGPFVFGVMAFTSVMFAGSQLLKITSWLMGGTIGFGTALEMILLALPSIIVYTLPMSTLLAVLLGIGRLSGDSEIVALFAGGMSFYRLAVPVLIMGIVISAGSIALNEVTVPWAYQRYEVIQSIVFKEEAPTQRAFSFGDDNMNMQVMVNGGIDVDKGELRHVTIIQFATRDGVVNGVKVAKGQPVTITYAERAMWDGLTDSNKRFKWLLYNSSTQNLGTDSPSGTSFSSLDVQPIEIRRTPNQLALYQMTNMRNTDQLSFRQLTQMVEQLKSNPTVNWEKIRECDVNRWNKFALPISSLVFALIAAPLGIRPSRSGSSVGFGLSILLILLYWIVWHFTSHLAIQGNLPAPAGAFMADVLGIIVALALIKRVAK